MRLPVFGTSRVSRDEMERVAAAELASALQGAPQPPAEVGSWGPGGQWQAAPPPPRLTVVPTSASAPSRPPVGVPA